MPVHSKDCDLCVGYGEIPVSLVAHISVAMLPEQGKVRWHRHGGRKSKLWVDYNDVVKVVAEYQRLHLPDTGLAAYKRLHPDTDPPTHCSTNHFPRGERMMTRIDPRAQRTMGTLAERSAAGDPEARAELAQNLPTLAERIQGVIRLVAEIEQDAMDADFDGTVGKLLEARGRLKAARNAALQQEGRP